MNNNGVVNNNQNLNVQPQTVNSNTPQVLGQDNVAAQPQAVNAVQPQVNQQPVVTMQPQVNQQSVVNSQPQVLEQQSTLNTQPQNVNAVQPQNVQDSIPTTTPQPEQSQPQGISTSNILLTSNFNKPVENKTEQPIPNLPPQKNKTSIFTVLLLIIIFLLGFYNVYITRAFKADMSNMAYNCTAATSSSEEIALDLNSTLVKDLYNKVKTSIREDVGQPEFNDNLKLYLAYRQVRESYKYDSNCNYFSNVSMEPYKCNVSSTFIPKAFTKETFIIEYKKMFGENTYVPLGNIKLTNNCIGGYQYIPEREEFVQGQCNSQTATSFKVTKELKAAKSKGNTLILTEDVKYKSNDKMELPSFLKSGTYQYIFKLDINYNYVLINRVYESNY